MTPETTGLYIHLPFCKRRCVYCDFPVVVGRDPAQAAYFAAVAAEIEGLAEATGRPRLETVYFGGGTPSRTPDGVERALAAVREGFRLDAEAEITVEANPDSATRETLDRLAAAGVNRLSLGVQTFSNERLERLGRLHDAEAAVAAAKRARSRFPSVSLDLICGVPGTGVEAWQEDLERAVALDPDHVSVYCLTLEEGTPLSRAVAAGRAPPPDEDLEAAHLEATAAYLPSRGYARYEISNFARPGRACRHNLRYWRNLPCLGAGLGAAAFWQGVRWGNTRDLDEYAARAASGPGPTFPPGPAACGKESLAPERALGESIVVGLRLTEGVDLEVLGARHGVDAGAVFEEVIADAVAHDLLVRRGSRIALTERGFLFANRVMAEFTLP